MLLLIVENHILGISMCMFILIKNWRNLWIYIQFLSEEAEQSAVGVIDMR